MDKLQLREEIRRQIKGLDLPYISESSRAITALLISLPEFSSADRVLTYLSVNHEVDTRALIAHCLSIGKPVAIPRTEPGRKMSFAQITSLSENMELSPYGIPEPIKSLPSVFPQSGDIIIVPGLCFDNQGFRLGHGGGYYDRFLSQCPAATVGLCRCRLLQQTLPLEPHDIPVNILITEKKIARPRRVPQV